MPEPRPRGKQKQSCDSCARSKRACNQGRPCEGCQLNNITCTYHRSTGNAGDLQPSQTIQETCPSLQQLPAPLSIKYEQANNSTVGPAIPPQDPRMRFGFLLNYTKPGGGSLLDFFGAPTTLGISTDPIHVTSTSLPFNFNPTLDFSGELGHLLQDQSLPILETFLQDPALSVLGPYAWDDNSDTHYSSPSPQYSSSLEIRLQELMSKLITAHNRLSQRRDGDVPSFSEDMRTALFTVPNLIEFTRMFFDYWYPNCPILHQPTYNLETVSLSLLFVVFLIGASYSSPRDTAGLAGTCALLCEEFVFEGSELKKILCNEGAHDPTSLQTIQAAFLVSVLHNWQNGTHTRQMMRRFRYCDVVTAARRLGLPSSTNPYATGIFPFDWVGYVAAEEKVRSVYPIPHTQFGRLNKYH